MFTNRPAMKFLVPFVAGIIIGSRISSPMILPALFVVVPPLMLVTFLAMRNGARLGTPLLLSLVFLLGAGKIAADANLRRSNLVSSFIAPGDTCTMTGVVTEIPRRGPASIRFIIEADSVVTRSGAAEAEGGVAVYLRRLGASESIVGLLTYGRHVRLRGELVQLMRARNPGEFDAGRFMELSDIYASLMVARLDTADLGPEETGGFLASLVYPLRRSAGHRIDSLMGGEEAMFLKGLLIGERSEISPDVRTAFVNAGVMHIIAVSGLHVAIVVLMLLFVLQILRVPEQVRVIPLCLLLAYYNFLTGGAASVTRSVIMAMVFLAGKALQRRVDIYNTLAVSGAIILLIDARQLFQPGFQLSFVAVFALVYLTPKVYALRKALPPSLADRRPVALLFGALAVSIGAGLGTLPFTSFYFQKISVIGFAANLVIVPLSNVILALGMLAVGISYVSWWVGSIYAGATSVLTTFLLKLVAVFGFAPFAFLESRFDVVDAALFYLAVAILLKFRDPASRKLAFILLLLFLNLWVYSRQFRGLSSGSLRATALDVGQGDAILLEFPDGGSLLVDAGALTFSVDAGGRFIVPYLGHERIQRLAAVLLTHQHSDHYGGLSSVMRSIDVGEFMSTGIESTSAWGRQFRKLVDSIGIPQRIVRSGDRIGGFGNARIYLLYPPDAVRGEGTGERINFNNRSIVMKVCYGSTSLLLMGDAEFEAEDAVVSAYGSFLRSDIIKVAHHGGDTGTGPRLLDAVHPSLALVSVGARNKFGHPAASVIARLRGNGCAVLRTDSAGAIVLESNGTTWERVEWR